MESYLLETIQEELKDKRYQAWEWTKPFEYPYIVGEYFENSHSFETYFTHGRFILSVIHRGKMREILPLIDELKYHFSDFRVSRINDDGKAEMVYITFEYGLRQLTNEMELIRYELNFNFLYSRGD